MHIIEGKALDSQTLENLGCSWHTDPDESSYISNEIIEITQEEADAFYEAGNELYGTEAEQPHGCDGGATYKSTGDIGE